MHPLWPHPLVLDFCHSDSSQYCVFVLCFFSCRWPYLDTRVQYKLLANQWTSTDADIQPVCQDILTSILEGVFVVFLVLSLHILYEVSGYFFMTWSCLCQPQSWILMIYEIGVMPYIQSAVLLDRLKERDFHRSFYHHSLIGCNFHGPHSVCNCMAVTIWTQDDIKC